MIKLIFNQLLHRLFQTKALFIGYFLFIFAVCIDLQSQQLISDYSVLSKLDVDRYITQENITFTFYTFLFVGVIFFAYKLYKDYKYGAVRWAILTNKKSAMLIGDTLFIFISILILYGICYVGIYHCVLAKLDAIHSTRLMRIAKSVTVYSLMQDIPSMHMLFPSQIPHMLANIIAFVFIAQLPVFISSVLVKGKLKLLAIITLCLVCGILIFIAIMADNVYVQILSYLIMIALLYYATLRIKTSWKGQ